MKPTSNIKKGKRFEDQLCQDIEAEGLGRATRTPGSGSGNRFKGDSFNNLPFLIEAKNQKSIHLLKWIDQTKEAARIGNKWSEKWMLVLRDPRTPEMNPEVYAVVDWYELLKLLKKESEPRVKEPDRQLKWKIQRGVDSLKSILKDLE